MLHLHRRNQTNDKIIRPNEQVANENINSLVTLVFLFPPNPCILFKQENLRDPPLTNKQTSTQNKRIVKTPNNTCGKKNKKKTKERKITGKKRERKKQLINSMVEMQLSSAVHDVKLRLLECRPIACQKVMNA